MENLKSPLSNDELKKIDEYISENHECLLSLSFSDYSDLRYFKVHVTDFEKYLTNLKVNEKTRAWYYLFSSAKKFKASMKGAPKRNKIDIEPNYNFKIEEDKKSEVANIIGGFVIIFIIIFGIWFFSSGDDNKQPSEADLEFNRMIVSQESVKKLLKDPDSAKFRNLKGLCGEVNSKNSFGGYTGYKRYIGTPNLTILEGENPEIDQAAFNDVWIKFCK